MNQTRPTAGQGSTTSPALRVLAIREAELLAIKGPCGNRTCRLHHAHSGPCDRRPVPSNPPTLRDIQAATHAEPVPPLTFSHVAVAGAVPAPADPKG